MTNDIHKNDTHKDNRNLYTVTLADSI